MSAAGSASCAHRPARGLRMLVWLVVVSTGATGTASAQVRAGCDAPRPRSIGVAIGRSSPYLEPDSTALGFTPIGSLSVRGGTEVAARAEWPVTGPLRVRVEGALARWDVRQAIADSIGSMSARHMIALVGATTGTAPACAYALAGGGLYSVGFRDTSLHRAGFAVAAGIDVPVGARNAVQVDATIHLINTGDGRPITGSSAIPTLSLLAGWAHYF